MNNNSFSSLVRRFRTTSLIIAGVVITFGSPIGHANAAKHTGDEHRVTRGSNRMMGKANPFKMSDLRASRLRRALERLPEVKRQRAMAALHRFSFPESDVDVLESDVDGAIYYIEQSVNPSNASVPTTEMSSPLLSAALDVSTVFSLHSNPGSEHTIYLDFDGSDLSATAWNQGMETSLFAEPYDTDGDQFSYSQEELQNIAEIWHRVSEDYSGFDVNVTTEDPIFSNPQTGRVVFTQSTTLFGAELPHASAGGVAYVGVFGTPGYLTYSPALIYCDNLSNGFAPFVAEAASHEMGHNLGLGHDGTSTDSYFTGVGSGEASWAPIMGASYGASVSQWSKGEYFDASNLEDDISIIRSLLNTAADDHGDTLSAASLLSIGIDGSVLSTTPETDPLNVLLDNKGIIGSDQDRDLFLITAGNGILDLTVTPAWAAWDRPLEGRGANLNLVVTLLDADGVVVATESPAETTDATITVDVTQGFYYLAVEGSGNSSVPFSSYGSHGHYYISGSVSKFVEDVTPPSPNPMSFLFAPDALGSDSVTMEAVAASDDSGKPVQYYFSCSSDAGSCADSGWVNIPAWVATGLAAESTYTFAVKARDESGNETGFSASMQATTAVDLTSPPVVPAAPAPASIMPAEGSGSTVQLEWADNSDNELGYRIIRQRWRSKRNRWSREREVDELPENTTSFTESRRPRLFRYRVEAFNDGGVTTSDWVEVLVTR